MAPRKKIEHIFNPAKIAKMAKDSGIDNAYQKLNNYFSRNSDTFVEDSEIEVVAKIMEREAAKTIKNLRNLRK